MATPARVAAGINGAAGIVVGVRRARLGLGLDGLDRCNLGAGVAAGSSFAGSSSGAAKVAPFDALSVGVAAG